MWNGWKMEYGEYRMPKENFLAYVKSVPVECLLDNSERKYRVCTLDEKDPDMRSDYSGELLSLLIFFKQYKLVKKLIKNGIVFFNNYYGRKIFIEGKDVFSTSESTCPLECFDAFWDMLKDCRFNDDCIRDLYENMKEKPSPFEYHGIDIKAVRRLHSILAADIKKDLKISKDVYKILPTEKTFCDIYLYYAERLKDDNEGLSLLLNSIRDCIYANGINLYPGNEFWYELRKYYECDEELKKNFLALAYTSIIGSNEPYDDGRLCLNALDELCSGSRMIDSDVLKRMLDFGYFQGCFLSIILSFERFIIDENLAYEVILGCYKEGGEYMGVVEGIERNLISKDLILEWSKECLETENYGFGVFLLRGLDVYVYRRNH